MRTVMLGGPLHLQIWDVGTYEPKIFSNGGDEPTPFVMPRANHQDEILTPDELLARMPHIHTYKKTGFRNGGNTWTYWFYLHDCGEDAPGCHYPNVDSEKLTKEDILELFARFHKRTTKPQVVIR